MEILGQVKAVINDNVILISLTTKAAEGDILAVIEVVKDERLKDLAGIEEIYYPKGEIRIVCQQVETLYLAERFKEVTEKIKKVTTPSPLFKGLLGPLAELSSRTEEVVDKTYGAWSAQFDLEKSLSLKFNKVITVGDQIGRI